MNDRQSPERLLSVWFESEAPVSAPDALRTDIYRATAAIRPRPAWLARLRGNPMDVIAGGASRRNSRLVPIVIVALVSLALVAGAAYIGSRGPTNDPLIAVPSASASPTASLAGSPAATPAPSALADAAIELPYNVIEVIVGDDTMWLSIAGEDTNELARAIYRVDLATNEATLVVGDTEAGSSNHVSFVQTRGSIWAVEDEASRMRQFDATSGQLLNVTTVGSRPLEPLAAFDSVWSENFGDGTVTRFDASTGDVITTILIPQFLGYGPRAIAAGASLVWAIDPSTDVMVGIDPATNAVAREIPLQRTAHCGVAVAAGRVWTESCDPDPIQAFDEASGAPLGTIDAQLPPVADRGVVWMPTRGEASTTIAAYDPTTLDRVDYPVVDLGVPAGYMTSGHGSLWYVVGRTVYRLSLDSLPSN